MAYTKQTWNNLDPATPINAARLSHIETQYDEATAYSDSKVGPFGLITVPIDSSLPQASIQALIDASPSGSRLSFSAGTCALNGPLVLPNDNVILDALQTTFTQSVWQRPAFDAIGRNGIIYDIGFVQFVGTRAGQGTSYRGSSGYVSTAAVWINGDRNYVRNLRSSGMVCGVFLSSWNGTSANDRVGVGNRLGKVEVDNYNFGLLYVGQDGLVVDDIYGHDDLDDSSGGNPTHVIYGSATTTFRATGGEFKSVRSKNNLSGQPVQVKYHDNLHIGSIHAFNCKGLLNIIDSNDLKLDSYSGLALLANGGQGAVTMQSTNSFSLRTQFGPGFVQLAANVDERAFNIVANDGEFDAITIESNHSSGINPTTAGGEILIRGLRNTLRKPKVRALGGAIPAIYAGFGAAADGTLISGPEITGALSGVKVGGGSVGVTVNYDAAMQTITGPSFFDTNNGVESVQTSTAPGASLSTFGDHGILALIAGAGTPTVGAANSALQVRVTPKRNITVTSVTWWSVTASGNYDMAIVDDLTNTVLWTLTSTAWPAAGKITVAVPNIKIVAGRTYRLVFAADNATGTLRGNQAPTAGMDQRLDGSTAATTVSSAFPIPTSTLVSGTSGNTTRTPLIIVGGT